MVIEKKPKTQREATIRILAQTIDARQGLLDLENKLQPFCEERLTEEQLDLYRTIKIIEFVNPLDEPSHHMGRPSYGLFGFRRALIAMSVLHMRCIEDVRKRLMGDSNLRLICGFPKVPSKATFSRKIVLLASMKEADVTQDALIRKYMSGRLVLHILRDSTAIETREKAENKRKDVISSNKKKYSGDSVCPGRDDIPRIVRQQYQSVRFAVASLPHKCQWGGKRNSQGNVYFWKGRKLHLDVTDTGIPISAIVTGAGVHDSQVAIPLEKMTSSRVAFCYSEMDKGYDASAIRNFCKQMGHIPIIDFKRRRDGQKPELDPAKKQRYKIRTTVERSNANIKDWILPDKLCLRSAKCIDYIILLSVVVLTVFRLFSNGFIPCSDF